MEAHLDLRLIGKMWYVILALGGLFHVSERAKYNVLHSGHLGSISKLSTNLILYSSVTAIQRALNKNKRTFAHHRLIPEVSEEESTV